MPTYHISVDMSLFGIVSPRQNLYTFIKHMVQQEVQAFREKVDVAQTGRGHALLPSVDPCLVQSVQASPDVSGGRWNPRGKQAATSTAPGKKRDGGTVRKTSSKTTPEASSSCHTQKQACLFPGCAIESMLR